MQRGETLSCHGVIGEIVRGGGIRVLNIVSGRSSAGRSAGRSMVLGISPWFDVCQGRIERERRGPAHRLEERSRTDRQCCTLYRITDLAPNSPTTFYP